MRWRAGGGGYRGTAKVSDIGPPPRSPVGVGVTVLTKVPYVDRTKMGPYRYFTHAGKMVEHPKLMAYHWMGGAWRVWCPCCVRLWTVRGGTAALADLNEHLDQNHHRPR